MSLSVKWKLLHKTLGLTTRKVLATFEKADCASTPSSCIGSSLMSSLN